MISTGTQPPHASFMPGSQNDENKGQFLKSSWKSWGVSTSSGISNFIADSAHAVWAGFKQGRSLFLGSATVLIAISPILGMQEDSDTRSQPPIPLYIPIVVCPILEELLCRGLVHNLASKMTHYIFQQKDNAKIAASCLSSGFFGLIHLFEPNPILKASFATVYGFAFARTYNEYGLLSSISSHITCNLLLNIADAYAETLSNS